MDFRQQAIEIFDDAVAAVQPGKLLHSHIHVNEYFLTICEQEIPKDSFHNLYVIGVGKAAAAMAKAVEDILDDLITDGIITTKYSHALPLNRIRVIEAAHPVPDQHCVAAVQETLELLQKTTSRDLIIFLISGGASALWCDVPHGIQLQDLQSTFDLLIRSGASIHEVNTVRKHLSAIKGGQLIRYCNNARVFSLIISDVPGDDPDVIGSGLTVPDRSAFRDAYTVLQKYDLVHRLPPGIKEHIEKGMQQLISETPKPGDPLFDRTFSRIIGNNQVALRAAAAKAGALGLDTIIVPGLITGDAEQEAEKLVFFAREKKVERPLCILQGGETTVKVSGKGKGGRNQHFALAALNVLSQLPDEAFRSNIIVLSGGTDGTDGPTDAAGAVIDGTTLRNAGIKQLSIIEYLRNNNAYPFFQQTDSLLFTGPTQTNVMDLMIAIVHNDVISA